MPTGNLPSSGRKLFEKVYNSALKGSCKGDKECAARTAWSATKGAGWHKRDGKWVKKSEILTEFPMYITKATYDGKVMRWAATNSDTAPDSYNERMSVELYEDFLGRIQNRESVPTKFKSVTSDFWKGGTPYLSISHYPDLNGKAVPGEVSQIYIDGHDENVKLKAKGVLSDSPLGHAVYRALKNDNNKSPEDKIRISIGFLDLAHRHGNGQLWIRDSLSALCPECLEGVGDKVYVKGYLVHLALTRVPVNKRTEMVLEEKAEMAKKKITRKDDAASIVGKDEAEKIDALNKMSAMKSDALVEMSEGEEPTAEETQELIEEAGESVSEIADNEDRTEDEEGSESELILESEHMTEADMKKKCMKEDGTIDEECMKKMKDKEPMMKSEVEETEEVELFEKKAENSGYLVADRGDGQPALPVKKNGKLDHRLMGAAWAALHGGYRGNKYEGKGKEQAIAKLKRLYKKEGMETPKSEAEPNAVSVEKFEDSMMDAVTNEPSKYVDNMPYGGATSMKDAEDYVAMQNETIYVMDMWSVLSNVVWNIYQRDDVMNKKEAIQNAVTEFSNVLAAKAMVTFSQAVEPIQSVQSVQVESHGLKPALDALLSAVDNSLALEGDVNNKLQFINAPLQELGQAITDYVTTKSVVEPPAPNKNNDNLLEKITELIQPISTSVQQLTEKVGILEAKSNAQGVTPKPRIPQPRSMSLPPSLVQKSEPKVKPGSIRDIVNKSVGITE